MNAIQYCAYLTAVIAATVLFIAPASTAHAHCDSMDGPVIADAQRALEQRSVEPVLKWIPPEDEATVKSVFQMALDVRGESDAARTLADRYFFDTLVRLHRASEGEGFTGIKPAGSVEPGIAAADDALESGEIDALADKLAKSVRAAVVQRFQTAHTARQSADKSPGQGRKYVATYVQFTHFVENLEHLLDEGASHMHRENLDHMH